MSDEFIDDDEEEDITANEILEAFTTEVPLAEGAFSDDGETFAFEWNFSDGSTLWLDFEKDKPPTILWRKGGYGKSSAKVFTPA
jgi:hypothetical protein